MPTGARGLRSFLGYGIRFFTSNAAATYIGLRVTSDPSVSFYLNLPTALPGSTQAVTLDSSGNIGTAAFGTGSVTSVAVSVPSWLTVSGSPVTTSGTIAITAASGQTQNQVLATPNGSSGAVSLRSLVAADIPTLTSAKISDFDAQVRTSTLNQLAAPTTSLSLNSQKIVSLQDGSGSQDAATWGQVQALYNGQDNKGSFRFATTGSLGLTSSTATTITKTGGLPSTVDGGTPSPGDVILVKDEVGAGSTGAVCNGPYIYSSGSTWTRATNADISAEVTSGLNCFISEGATNAGTFWVLRTADPIVLGTTQLTFAQFGGMVSYTNGNGLTLTGTTFAVQGVSGKITVSGAGVTIDSGYIGQASITTAGTFSTGVWNASVIDIPYGGTNANTAAGARTNLSAAGIAKGTFTSASLSAGVLTINPGLGQQYGTLIIIDNTNQVIGQDNTTFTSATAWSADLTSFGTISGTYRWIAIA